MRHCRRVAHEGPTRYYYGKCAREEQIRLSLCHAHLPSSISRTLQASANGENGAAIQFLPGRFRRFVQDRERGV